MTLNEAKRALSDCVRETLSDHAFGDCEVYWMRGEEKIAVGYFGNSVDEVTVGKTRFTAEEARALRTCGKRGRATRNDIATEIHDSEVDESDY